MNNQLFRSKSIERISSPEQLNDYVRVSNPGVWIVLTAIILLLTGACIWGIFGHLDTKLTAAVKADNGTAVCYVRESDIADVKLGQTVKVNGSVFTVTNIQDNPEAVTDDFGDYALHIGELSEGEWVYAVTLDGTLPDGVYSAVITIESISPISFLYN